jgi:hypothetical protein
MKNIRENTLNNSLRFLVKRRAFCILHTQHKPNENLSYLSGLPLLFPFIKDNPGRSVYTLHLHWFVLQLPTLSGIFYALTGNSFTPKVATK